MNRRQMLVLAVIATASLVAQNQFLDERYYERTRLTTTLLGSAYNGNTLLAYGEGGVILRTTDRGETWSQIQLPDSLHILFITSIGQRFVGLCHRYFGIVSDDDGQTWHFIPLDDTAEYWVAKEFSNQIVALSTNHITFFDQSLRRHSTLPLVPADSGRTFAINERFIVYSPSKGVLAIVDRQQQTTRLVNLSSVGCDMCSDIRCITFHDQERVYFLSNRENYIVGFNVVTQMVEDTLSIRLNSYYWPRGQLLSYNGTLYLFHTLNQTNNYQLDSIFYLRYNRQDKSLTQLNQSPLERYLFGSSPYNIRAYNDSLLIVVGQEKLILASYDGGRHWKMLSWGPVGRLYSWGDTVRIIYGKAFVTSTNNGITWKSQRLDNYRLITELYPTDVNIQVREFYDYRTPSLAYAFSTRYEGVLGDHFLVSTDGGETFTLRKRPYAFTVVDGRIFPFNYRGNYHLYAQWMGPPSIGEPPINWSFISAPLDDTLGGETNYAVLRNTIVHAFVPRGDTLWAILTDSTTGMGLQHNGKYKIRYSTGDLRQWHDFTLTATMSRNNMLVNVVPYGGRYLFIADTRILLRVDLENGESTIFRNTSLDGGSIASFYFWKDTLFLNVFIYNFVNGQLETRYDLLKCAQPLLTVATWTKHPAGRFVPSQHVIVNDSVLYVVLSERDRLLPFLYQVNLYRVVRKSVSPVETLPAENNTVLWLSPSQPHPATDNITVHVYHDQSINPSDLRFRLYNIHGIEQHVPMNLSIDSAYRATLQIDTHTLPPGVYIAVAEYTTFRASRTILVIR